jgi:alanine-glyoxylate transaminase/serine-glyoxylate transaminase/serine-pyruvate transaminase
MTSALDGYRLMIPGPIQLHPEVLAELSRPSVPHYGADWTDFYNATVECLRQVCLTSGEIFIIPGSGSAGLDAALGSSLAQDDKLLVLSNGFFGERLASIARAYKPNSTVLSSSIERPVEPEKLEEVLTHDSAITAVAVCHSESSSGLLNPIREIASVCQRRGVLLIVDAISSLGGVELRMDEWGVGLCVGASQKCLEGPAGLAVVAVGEAAWRTIAEKRTPGWYLNLHVWKQFADEWADWHPYPITMAVPAVRALRQGLERVLAEGLTTRWERHRRMADLLRLRLSSLGYEPVFSPEIASPTVVAFFGRRDLPAGQLVQELRTKEKILIAGGMGAFKGKAFRIGNMGPQAEVSQITELTEAVARLTSSSTSPSGGDF